MNNIKKPHRSRKVTDILEKPISPYLRYGACCLIIVFILIAVLASTQPVMDNKTLYQLLFSK